MNINFMEMNEFIQHKKDFDEFKIEIPYFKNGISLSEIFKKFNVGLGSFITIHY